jgi:heme oxygenase
MNTVPYTITIKLHVDAVAIVDRLNVIHDEVEAILQRAELERLTPEDEKRISALEQEVRSIEVQITTLDTSSQAQVSYLFGLRSTPCNAG